MITPEDIKSKTIERFWSKIKFGEPNECWIWDSWCSGRGYGSFKITPSPKNPITVKCSRYLYEIVYGAFDSKLYVCHTCDNPPCVNPNHFWLGTCKQNVDDMVAKGRNYAPVGTQHTNAKLDDDKVRDILKRLFMGESAKSIARVYNVSDVLIDNIRNGLNWTHVKSDYKLSDLKKKIGKLSEDQVREIRKRLASGEGALLIAPDYSVDPHTIRTIKRGISWKHVKN